MPAHARARSGQEQQGIGVVSRSDHGRLLYAGRLTFHPRRTARLAHGRWSLRHLDSQPEVLDLLAHQLGGVTAARLDPHHLGDVLVAEADDELAVVDSLLPAGPPGRLVEVSTGDDQGEQVRAAG
ncbi:MAG: hypothetical protein ACRDNZ_12975 [Streptosporangiaceae bacterium]